MTIADYYKYAVLSTASYVRMGGRSLDGATFAQVANDPQLSAGGRLPTVLGTELFNPADPMAARWDLLSYYGSDIPSPNAANADKSGFGATLFARTENGQTEKVLAMRGTEPLEDGKVDLLSADLGQIGILGLALTQVVSMANYVARLRETSSVFVTQLKVEARTTQPS